MTGSFCMQQLGREYKEELESKRPYDADTFNIISDLYSKSNSVMMRTVNGKLTTYDLRMPDTDEEEAYYNVNTPELVGKVIKLPVNDEENKFNDGISFFVAAGLLNKMEDGNYLVLKNKYDELQRTYNKEIIEKGYAKTLGARK